MIKNLTLLIFSLLFCQVVKAQKTTDTLLYYMNNSNQLSTAKDADYFIIIMPIDSETHLYTIKMYYDTGKPMFVGSSKNNNYDSLSFEGPCIYYFRSGVRKDIVNYEQGSVHGNWKQYYPNGNLYTIKNFTNDNRELLVECRDSLGNILTKNGNGKWMKFDDKFKETDEGKVKDSLENGKWLSIVDNIPKYETIYDISGIKSSTDSNVIIGERIFHRTEKGASFPGGKAKFNTYLAKNVKFPAIDRKNGTRGRVILQFVIEKDGSLSNVRAIQSPSKTIADEAERVMKLCPSWIPAMQNDKPVRTQFTTTFAFSLAD